MLESVFFILLFPSPASSSESHPLESLSGNCCQIKSALGVILTSVWRSCSACFSHRKLVKVSRFYKPFIVRCYNFYLISWCSFVGVKWEISMGKQRHCGNPAEYFNWSSHCWSIEETLSILSEPPILISTCAHQLKILTSPSKEIQEIFYPCSVQLSCLE